MSIYNKKSPSANNPKSMMSPTAKRDILSQSSALASLSAEKKREVKIISDFDINGKGLISRDLYSLRYRFRRRLS